MSCESEYIKCYNPPNLNVYFLAKKIMEAI